MVTRKKEHALIHDYHLLSYDVVDSTNEEAKRLAEGGGSHGAVIWAKRQTHGRGRMGREWVSHEGNLYVSVLLMPPCDIAIACQLSFVAAVAALEALAPIVPDRSLLSCKWPNDILYDGRKLGGILLESFHAPHPDRPGIERLCVVVGVGINVDNFPDQTPYPAISLKSSGVEIISAKIVLSRFVHHFIEQYDLWRTKGFAPIRKLWLTHAHGMAQEIEVRLPDETLTGTFKGIDAEGHLMLSLPGRKKRLISAGDVFFKQFA